MRQTYRLKLTKIRSQDLVWHVIRILLMEEDLNQELKSFLKISKLVGMLRKPVYLKQIANGGLVAETPSHQKL